MIGGLLYDSEIGKSLYEDYQPGFRNQLKNTAHYWYKNFKGKSAMERVDGKYAIFALEYGINGGAGAIGDEDDYKMPRTSDVENQKVYIKNLQVQGGIGTKVIKASKNGGAFEDLLQREMKRVYLAAKDDQARGIVIKEDEVIETISTAIASGVISTSTALEIEVPNVHRFQVGLMVDILDADGGDAILANNLVIVGLVKGATPKIRVKKTTQSTLPSGNLVVAIGDKITNNGAFGKGITGLEDAFASTGTYHGIARSGNEWYLPQTFDHSNTELDEMAIRIITDDAEIESESQIDNFVARHEVVRGYENQLATLKQYNNSPRDGQDGAPNLAGGYKYLTFDGQPFWKDRLMTMNKVYGLNTNTWFEEMHCDWEFDDLDGNLFKFTSGQKYYFRMLKYVNISTDTPRANFVIDNVKELTSLA